MRKRPRLITRGKDEEKELESQKVKYGLEASITTADNSLVRKLRRADLVSAVITMEHR